MGLAGVRAVADRSALTVLWSSSLRARTRSSHPLDSGGNLLTVRGKGRACNLCLSSVCGGYCVSTSSHPPSSAPFHLWENVTETHVIPFFYWYEIYLKINRFKYTSY